MSGKSRPLARLMTTHTEAYVEFDGYQVGIHCLTNGPAVLFPWGPLSTDRLGECTSRIERKSEYL